MNTQRKTAGLPGWIRGGLVALTLVGAAGIATPSEALPVASAPAAAPSDVSAVAYRRYYHRRFYHRRVYRHRRPVPCRGGVRSHLSRRYC